MKIIPITSLGRIADQQICPRRRYWRWHHLGTGVIPEKLTYKQTLECILASSIYAILQNQEPPDCYQLINTLAITPGIRDLADSKNPADEVQELGRLATAMTMAWTRRRAPIIARSEHQPATIIIAVSQHQPAMDRPDSRLFDVLMEEDSVVFERFVTGQRWMGWRFNNILLYYWRTVERSEISYYKPAAKALCYEPPIMKDWIERLEKEQGDPIAKVILGGKTVTFPDNNIHVWSYLCHKEMEVPNEVSLIMKYPQYFHSCHGCEYAQICFGPEPFPVDAVEAYPGIYKKRE